MKKIIALLLVITLFAVSLYGCGSNFASEIKATASTDKYRNFYQIFVCSFNDSDGDAVGDLQGIIDKLDYLNDGDPETGDDLGIDGIWLSPIMPSPSYHKYDVQDYYNIDERFGDLKVFDKLVKECHKRGIKLVIDMVLNHCSSNHPLFKSACEQALEGNLDDDAKYFEIAHYDDNPGEGYTGFGKGYFYESNFSPSMPEWNLNAECTRDYFKDVAKFWLSDHDVDGFRLDATLYFTNSDTDGKEFLNWYYNAARKIKKDVYMVGEHWTVNADIQDMYSSGIDSFFAFGFAGATGPFVNAVRTSSAAGMISSVKDYEANTKKQNKNAINAYFLSNHDQIRIGNGFANAEQAKMAAAVYMLVPGNSFIYYGEEIGLDGGLNNGTRRTMPWSKKSLWKNGIYDFYRKIIEIRKSSPAVKDGKFFFLKEYEEPLLAFERKNGSGRIACIMNCSDKPQEAKPVPGKIIMSENTQTDNGAIFKLLPRGFAIISGE